MLRSGINKRTIKYIILYFSVISALELLAYGLGGIFSIVASYLWLFSGLFWLGYLLFYIGLKTVEDIKNRKYIIFGSFTALMVFLVFFMGNLSFSDINPDAAQQAAAGLDAFEKPDFNYTGTAFLGYPARQYIIAALPSFIFGRNVLTLHLGFGLPFLMGLSLLFFSLRDWLKMNSLKEEYALLPCVMIIAFPFISEYYMNFEQAITPVSLTMLGLGVMLKLSMEPDLFSVLSLSYLGCLMADSYTPSLASMGLVLVFLCAFALKTNSNKESGEQKYISTAVWGCAVNITVFFAANYLSGSSDKIKEFRETNSLVKTALTSWKEFFTDEHVRFLGFFGGILLIYMILSITLRLKLHDLFISLWILGVVFFSDYMVGYTTYEKCWVMQRNMIVIPVAVVFIFIAAMSFIKKYGITINRPVIIILIISGFAVSVFNFKEPHKSFRYFSYVQPIKYAIDYIEDTLKEYDIKTTDNFNLYIYTDNALESNMADYAAFFFPNAETFYEPEPFYTGNPENSYPTLYFSENKSFSDLVPTETGIESFEEFSRTGISSQTYLSQRYDTEITWYRKVVLP